MALFLLANAVLASLPTFHFVPLRLPFPFRQTQFFQVFPLKATPFCQLSGGLDNTNKSAAFLRLSICPRHWWYLFRLSYYLKLFGTSGRNRFFSPPLLSGYDGSPDTYIIWETTRLMSWPDGVWALFLSFCFHFFSDCRHIALPKFIDTQVPSVSTEELVLPHHARCVLSRLRCN